VPSRPRGHGRGTIATVLLSCAAATFVVSAQTAPLALVSTAWPPFTNEQGQPRFALDLIEAALARVGLSAKTTIVAAPDFTTRLLNGPFDGSAAVWKDPERERVLLFSQPYLQNRLVLIGRSGANVSARTLNELGAARVALVEGYSYGDGVDRGGPVFVRLRSEEESLTQLLTGAVDYTLMDELVVQYIVSNYPEESGAKLAIGTVPLVTRELYLAIRRDRVDAKAIVDRFNAQLAGLIADRTYHRLLHVDWIRADVNGDGVPEYVPANDRPGPLAPQHSYALFSSPEATSKDVSTTPGFYVGGNIYAEWANVPESYREVNPQYPDPRRSQASIFKFTW
jgi:polar amino acid transport system substrate-binding protein